MAMGYIIDYKPDKDYVNIKVKGKLNFKLAEEYSIEAIKLAHENNCRKFLINHTETKLEETGIYKLHTDGAALEKFGFKNIDKIAIVILHTKDDRLFFEKIEHDAKWSNFKYFGTVEEALYWLDIVG
jgi:hypothetical protein